MLTTDRLRNKLQAKEDVKVSKSKPNEVIIVVDDDDESDEESSETDDALSRVLEPPLKGSLLKTQKPKTCDMEIIVLDDVDETENASESIEDKEMSSRSENKRRFRPF